MVKNNKFAAEPTADASADSKVTKSAPKITTTDGVNEQGTPESTDGRKSPDSDNKIYSDYAHGKTIDDIAADNNMTTNDVLSIINKKESR